MIMFPCAVHRDHYDNCRIVESQAQLDEFRADGWMTSDEWYSKMLGVGAGMDDEPVKRGPGRPRKEG
jgi:hypothetical protein